MGSVLSRPAYAKINLHLAVGLPYEDGYHPIQSLFALVDLCDTISLSWEERDRFSIEVTGLEQYCKQGDDTLTKAAMLWQEASGFPVSLSVHCEKRIPVKAGLGGGSSDAAVLLSLLQSLSAAHALDVPTLSAVALKVGSDVPFFLSNQPMALVCSRGEHIVPVTAKPLEVLLVMPNFFDISTSDAYRALDAQRRGGALVRSLSDADLMEIYTKPSHQWKGMLYNDFQPCSGNEAFYGSLQRLSDRYKGYGSMSGSGACWFFVSEDASEVHSLHAAIQGLFAERVRCWITHILA
ncbi:MAG: 4-(cytidine 5'-diphospho)-2-C-methyl-D-erythritol kinase [Sphaerochaeta sp.]|jgi:4-diphosphocytidyl-2-C-methyl-D-erythritol kinase|uniref:4-(cytidine 5'-diphospho)-2-C-methyl-D-erythritol kinase n=1 Tax=Sphaerochaeta sp. TaxID=1972642 RepID=UPI002FC90926